MNEALYKQAKDAEGQFWYQRLLTDKYTVDDRVIKYMKNWEYICDWQPK